MTLPNRRLSRSTLVLVAVLFLAPFIAALVLNRLGWHPQGGRNHGELIEPPQALADRALQPRDGAAIHLVNPDHRYTLLLRLPEPCADDCLRRLDDWHRVRLSLGRHAPRLLMATLGTPPASPLPPSWHVLDDPSTVGLLRDSPLLAALPAGAALLVDANGWQMLRFPPDLAASLARKDLGRLIK